MLENLRLGLIAAILTGSFTAYCFYLVIVRNPARRALPKAEAFLDWKRTHRREYWQLGALATLASVAALGRWHFFNNAFWLLDAFLMIGYWPYMSFIMGPTYRKLMAPGFETTALVLPVLHNWSAQQRGLAIMGLLATVFSVAGAIGYHYGRY